MEKEGGKLGRNRGGIIVYFTAKRKGGDHHGDTT